MQAVLRVSATSSCSFGLTRSFAGKAADGGAAAKQRAARDGAANGQVVGDAGHEMLSFKEVYLFVGTPRNCNTCMRRVMQMYRRQAHLSLLSD